MHEEFRHVMSVLAGLPDPIWIEMWRAPSLPTTVHYGYAQLDDLLARFGADFVFRPHAVVWTEANVEIWCGVPNGEHDALLSRIVDMQAAER